MKLTHFKIVPFILAGTALLALSGCDGTTGISSDSGIGADTSAPVTQTCLEAAGYGTIVINGRTWLDRNLGASEVAADVNDTLAYGDLYQWGRSADGHQVRTSDINDTLATTLDNVANTPWEGKFIASNRSNGDWLAPGVDDNGSLRVQSWSSPYDEITNPNQVCPCGYVVPTQQDFIDLNMTADPSVADTFKLAYANYRYFWNGDLDPRNQAVFWTRTTKDNQFTAYAYYTENFDEFYTTYRGYGFSVRCIKPQ